MPHWYDPEPQRYMIGCYGPMNQKGTTSCYDNRRNDDKRNIRVQEMTTEEMYKEMVQRCKKQFIIYRQE